MRLTRPLASVLLVGIVLLLVWLVLGQAGTGEDPGANGPSPTAQAPVDDGGAAADDGTGAAADDVAPFDPDAEDNSSAEGAERTSGDEPRGVDTRDWDDIGACWDDDLPAELAEVADDVEDGGPFDHPGKDGSTFGNYEGYLPGDAPGYYREYTVATPGLDHRGARRIVAGGGATDPEVWYYTDDHYESFCEFAP